MFSKKRSLLIILLVSLFSSTSFCIFGMQQREVLHKKRFFKCFLCNKEIMEHEKIERCQKCKIKFHQKCFQELIEYRQSNELLTSFLCPKCQNTENNKEMDETDEIDEYIEEESAPSNFSIPRRASTSSPKFGSRFHTIDSSRSPKAERKNFK